MRPGKKSGRVGSKKKELHFRKRKGIPSVFAFCYYIFGYYLIYGEKRL